MSATRSQTPGVIQPPMSSDFLLLATAVLLTAFGFVMVASASMYIADQVAGRPFYYVSHHALYIALGVGLGIIAWRIPLRFWARHGLALYVIGVLLLALLLVPEVGRKVNGSVRWIPIGPFNLQVSEWMKLIAVIYMAGYLVRRRDALVTSLWAFLYPIILLSIAALLMLLEPDLGAAMVVLCTAIGMLFLGGVRLWQFGLLAGVAGSAFLAMVITTPFRLQRLMVFLNPWEDPYNSGFQLTQSLIAFGRGDLWGVGLGEGMQKLFYLPEAYTDFLFAVIGEETGLLGTLVVMSLFSVLVWRAFHIAAMAERLGQTFNAHLAYGLGLWIGMQALVNMGVNMGALPTKGLTLPLMSYGGNSMLTICVAIALLLRVRYEAVTMPERKPSWVAAR